MDNKNAVKNRKSCAQTTKTLASARDTPEGAKKMKKTTASNEKENAALLSDEARSPKVDKKIASINPLTARRGPNNSTLSVYPTVFGATENEFKGANLNWVSMWTLPSFVPDNVNLTTKSNLQTQQTTLESYETNDQNDTTSSDSQEDQLEDLFNHDMDLEVKPSQTSPQYEISNRFESEFDSIEKIGRGGFGRVFKARHKLFDMFYAIKIVRRKPNSLREAQALIQCNHVNIVRCLNYWTNNCRYDSDSQSSTESGSSFGSPCNSSVEYLYIQMELCDGTTLRDWIEEKNAKESVEVFTRKIESLNVILQIVTGVEHIHSKKFIHNDLKPENIMIDGSDQVKIGDFGLVTADCNDSADIVMERTTENGTPSYMAPEQSNKTYNCKVDIFAVGLIYFELLWKLSTWHERAEIWADVRQQKLPKEFGNRFFEEYMILKPTLSAQPHSRPEASELKKALEEYVLRRPQRSRYMTV